MGTITFLGTGAGDGGTTRNKTSILIRSEKMAILLDAGEPCTQTLFSLGLGQEDVKTIFISHCHGDHVAGLPALIQYKQVCGRKHPLTIHLPEMLVSPLCQWLEVLSLPPCDLSFPLHFHSLVSGEHHAIDALSVSAFPTTHDCKNSRESFGFVVEKGNRRLVYSGDLGSVNDLQTVLETHTDALICELAHISPDDLLAILKDKPISLLFLTHLGLPYLGEIQEIAHFLDAELPCVKQVFLPMDCESYSL